MDSAGHAAVESSVLAEYLDALTRGEEPAAAGLPAGAVSELAGVRDLWGTLRAQAAGARPAHIAGYAIERELGRGGFGVVYLGWDGKAGRHAAVKQPLIGALFAANGRARFLQEARTAANLDHANVVPVYETGEDDGVPYIAYAFVAGGSLADWLAARAGAAPAAEAVAVLRGVAAGVAHAHSRGVLHRDLKPENVLVPADGSGPRVTDFGLALAFERTDGLTASHAVVGTAAYMAPEQAAGDRRAVDVRSDVWALGVMLFELLTGRRPFPGPVLTETDPPPLRPLRRDIPKDLEAVCRKSLAFRPAGRYESVADLIADLDRVRDGQPTKARPRGPAGAAWALAKRRPAAALALLLAAITLTAGPAAAIAARDLRRTAETEQQNARAVTLAGAVRQRLSARPPGWVAANLADLEDLSRLPQYPAHAAAARDDWFATLAAEEWDEIPWAVPPGHYEHSAQSPDGRWLAVVQTRVEAGVIDVHLYDARTLALVRTILLPAKRTAPNVQFSSPVDGGKALAFSPDSRTLYIGVRSGWVYVRGVDGAGVGEFEAFNEFVGGLAVSPDGTRVYVAGRYCDILRSFSTNPLGKLLAASEPPAPGGPVPNGDQWVGCTPDGKYLLCPLGAGRAWRVDPVILTGAFMPPTPPSLMKEVWQLRSRDTAWLPARDWAVSMNEQRVDFVDTGHFVVADTSADLNRYGGESSWLHYALSDDGRYLACSNRENVIVWDIVTREPAARIALRSPDAHLRFLAGGDRLLVMGPTQRAFQRRGSPHCRVFAGSPMVVNQFALLPGRDEVLTLANAWNRRPNSRLAVWNATTGEKVREVIADYTARINADFAVAPDSRRAAVVRGDGGLHLVGWNPDSNTPKQYPDTRVDSPQARVFTADGLSLWVVEKNHLQKLSAATFAKQEHSEPLGLTEVDERYNCLILSSTRLAAGRGTGEIDLFRATTGGHLASVPVSQDQILALANFPAGRLLASDGPGNVHIVDAATRTVQTLPTHHKGRVPGLAVHPNQTTIATGGIDGQLILWKHGPDGWAVFARLPTHGQPVRQLAFDGAGKRLFVLLDRAHHVIVWKLDRLPGALKVD